MAESSSFRWADLLWFLLVVAIAGGARAWYVHQFLDDATTNPTLVAQDASPPAKSDDAVLGKENPSQFDLLVYNLREENSFSGPAPLASESETTAHVAPGYPFLVSMAYRFLDDDQAPAILRWVQCGLGALAAGFFFFFARRAFRNLAVALLAGLFCALHPLWIINVGEINDGVVTTVLLALAMASGARAGEEGGAFTSLIFGLGLAGLALVRAALLPFGVVGLLWFLLRCRKVPRGWLCAVLAVLGFANGVAAWTVYNFKAERFGEFVPIADSAFVHLWAGNNPNATGGPLTEAELRASLAEDGRITEVLAEENQSRRYQMLAKDVVDYAKDNPAATLQNRVRSALYFFFGKAWLDSLFGRAPQAELAAWSTLDPEETGLPVQVTDHAVLILNSVTVAMLALALLGWRWTFAWRKQAGLAAAATIWIPIPYILAHAGNLWGARLPLDGVFLCYAAFAIVFMIPILRGRLSKGPGPAKKPVDDLR